MAEIARPLPAPPVLREALTPRRLVVLAAVLGLAVASVALLVPAVAGLPDAGARLADGDARWLVLALGLEVLSFVGHIVLFRAVSLRPGSRIGMRESYQITLAGHAATRLFASAGAGGVALTAWALRRSGMGRREVGERMVTFIVLLYSVYMAALLLGGLALFTGLLPGASPAALDSDPRRPGRRRHRRRAGDAARGRRPRGTLAPARAPRRPPRPVRRARGGHAAGDCRRRARGAAPGAPRQPRSPRRRHVVGLRRRRAVGVLPGLRRRPARRRSWWSATSSACSPTPCRCRAASAAWMAA